MASKKAEQNVVTYVTKGLQNGDPTVVGIIVAVVVVLLTIIFFAVRSRRGTKRQGILLMGICDSGKTLMFTRLVHKKFKQSVTSVKPNSGSIGLPQGNKSLPVTDLPGHERLRTQMLDDNKALARGLVFVVDSGTVLKEMKEVAEYLYTILTDRVISQNAPPLLIACNKQDLMLSKGAGVIQKAMEKEINTLRVTQSAALQSTDSTGNNNTFLGKRDKHFSFADIKPLRVEFVECSARGKDENGEADLEPVLDWIGRVA
ncbi:signal recognition particle receptor subunit beta-like [Littorina saxatilis]|uniref:Signal recognition particle receptor subunit beta n=1 Tax=Littorina saxatilis TaxID=31220 RepID=A0AAN9AWG2_9CAEN